MTKARDLANGGFGLVLVKPSSVVNGTDNGKGTVSFSSVGSVSLNGVFSSTYTTYRIVIRSQHAAGIYAFNMKMRASNADSSASYYWSGQYQSSAVTTEGGENGANVSSYQIGGIDSQEGVLSLDINNPFQSKPTTFVATGWDGTYKRLYAGGHGVTSPYDGFTLFPATGNFTGTISVYGYNN